MKKKKATMKNLQNRNFLQLADAAATIKIKIGVMGSVGDGTGLKFWSFEPGFLVMDTFH